MSDDPIDNESDSASTAWNIGLERVAWSVGAGIVLVCLLAAARQSVPPGSRRVFDFALFALIPALGLAVVLRFILSFPTRFFELFSAVACTAVAVARTYNLSESGAKRTVEPVQLALCLLAGDVVLFGFGVGLRHCALLRVTTTWKRLAMVGCGLAYGPSLVFIPSLPLVLILNGFRTLSDATLSLLLALWLSAAGVIAANAHLSIKALQLRTEAP